LRKTFVVKYITWTRRLMDRYHVKYIYETRHS